MGNRQSVTITHPKADGKQVKIDDANGHAMSGLDLTDAVTCEGSVQQNTEPPPITVTLDVKPPPALIEANGTKVKAQTVSVEAGGNQVSAEFSTPAVDTPKQVETPSMFNKMFKKKTGLVFPPSEVNVAAEVPIVTAAETSSQNSNPTAVSVKADGIQAKAPAVSVQAAGIQVNATTSVSAESSTPAKDTPKQAETSSVFDKMFKKKTVLVSPASEASVAAEVPIVLAVETSSQNANPTAASVEVKAPAVSVEAAGIQVNATTSVSAESSTPAKDTPKQAETSSKFNKMFKKKTGIVAAEVPIVLAVETSNQNSNPTAVSVEADGIQVKAPAVSVAAAGIQVNATTSVSAESSTPAKDTPKQVETSSVFNKMFKKKTGIVAAEVPVALSVETSSQNSNPTAMSVEVDGIQVKAPAVSVEAAGIQVNATTSVSAESSTPAKDTPKQVETSSVFNKMFKKKTGIVAAEVPVALSVETSSQNSNQTAVSVEADGIQVKAPAVSVEAAGIQVNATTSVSAESSTPSKDTPKQVETSSKFNKMFKKKTGIVAAEVPIVLAVETSSQNSNPTAVSVEADGIQVKAPAVSVQAAGIQVNATTSVSAESSTSAKDTPKQAESPSVFDKMFRKKTMLVIPPSEVSVGAEVPIVPAVEKTSQNSNPTAVSVEADGIQVKAPAVSVQAAGIQVNATTSVSESSTPAKDTPKQAESPNVFNKMFKKKTMLVFPPSEVSVGAEVPTVHAVEITSQNSEPTDIKTSTQADKEPQGEASTEVTQDSTQTEQTSVEEKTVMNFFKTLVTSTKTTTTASPDVSKEQSQKETPPAPAANVQEASKVPPPPPPAPPKMESKAEPAVKKEEAPPGQVAAAGAKQPETPGKAKTKDSAFSKLFRSKSGLKEEAKPIEIQVDASKTRTLEISAKTEPPPAPKPEDKKAEKKPSPFANLLKPKVLLGQVSSKIHAAASSAAASISLGAGGGAAEPKKEAPAAVTAPAEAAPSTKAKEEPKPAAAAPPPAASADNKSVGSTDDSSPSTSRKLEKRNSIQLFFKNLGQKRHSDAGVQTEAGAAEKAK